MGGFLSLDFFGRRFFFFDFFLVFFCVFCICLYLFVFLDHLGSFGIIRLFGLCEMLEVCGILRLFWIFGTHTRSHAQTRSHAHTHAHTRAHARTRAHTRTQNILNDQVAHGSIQRAPYVWLNGARFNLAGRHKVAVFL